ncbi:MAG TPA: hypothetical protein VIC71_13170 [Gammaproteobacteria bacterium]|jgi:hypothetical protein
MPVGTVRVLALLALAFSSVAVAEAQTPSARDFSGVYFPAPGSGRQRLPSPLPYTPAAQALADEYAKQFRIEDDPGYYCIWPGMPRAPWGAPFAIEVFHRPQDLTIFWEGYGMYRKVYMADHNPPEAILPSAMGHSIAHWEDDVLVIETTHLKAYPYMSRFPTTSDAHIVERMWLEERVEEGQTRKYLVDELVVTDPKLYTEPIRTRAEAVHRPDLTILEYTCSVSLWEAYLAERGLVLPDVDALPNPGD